VKVALIIEWLDAWRGGAETSTEQFIQHLLALGVEIDVLTRSRVSSRPGMAVHRIPVTGLSRALQTISFCRRADRRALSLDVDLIHAITPSLAAHVYQPRGGTYAETIDRNIALRRTPGAQALKRLIQRFNLKQRLLLNYERRMLSRPVPPHVIAISDYVGRQLQRHYAFPVERIHRVFNGVDPDETDSSTRARDRAEIRALYDIGRDDLLVLLVAHNFRLKGLTTWIEALALLHRDHRLPVKSLVIGKDRVWRWQKMVDHRGLSGMLQFTGPTPRVRAFYHAADVLAHPTHYDPCSRVVLEAMMSGLPCVTSVFDGASEVIDHGVNGFVLASPGDAEALAATVRSLSSAPLRTRIGLAATAAAGSWSMRRHAEEVLAVYRKITKGALRT
jgi:UDP-glucose:(heptosyl)LPS alpha-1,3-glucosyltransferase